MNLEELLNQQPEAHQDKVKHLADLKLARESVYAAASCPEKDAAALALSEKINQLSAGLNEPNCRPEK